MRSSTRPPHSPGRLSAVSIAANSGQTQNDSRLNPFARIFRLYVSSRSEFVAAINISSVVKYVPQKYATIRGPEAVAFQVLTASLWTMGSSRLVASGMSEM